MHNIVEEGRWRSESRGGKRATVIIGTYKIDFIHMMDDVCIQRASPSLSAIRERASTDGAHCGDNAKLGFNELNKGTVPQIFYESQ